MIALLFASLGLLAIMNFSLVFWYRQAKFSNTRLQCLLITANFTGIYISQIMMGISWSNIMGIIIAVIAGVSIGLQGARVITQISGLEEGVHKKEVSSPLDDDSLNKLP